ncbi:MAG: transposase [Leptospiraceae bacterium]|nr:transposase [Leptospiraceae bacterium]
MLTDIRPIPQLIPKGILNYISLSYIIVQKFCDSLPLYRICGILQRYGFGLSLSTLSDNLLKVYERIEPVVNEILRSILNNTVLQIDETYFSATKRFVQ